MTYDRELLRRWCRPEEVLHPEEQKRVGEFLELFDAQLVVMGAGPEPPIVVLYAARRITEIIWEFDRTTSSRRVTAGRKRKSRTLERQDIFEDSEVRHRQNNLALEEIDSARLFAKVAAGAVEVNVVAFDPARRKTG